MVGGQVLARDGRRLADSPEHWEALTTKQHVMHALAHLDRYISVRTVTAPTISRTGWCGCYSRSSSGRDSGRQ